MKIILQRCKSAKVIIKNKVISSIDFGVVLFLGFEKNDTEKDVNFFVNKILRLRVFNDRKNKMNLSIKDVNGSVLVISQFTLCADIDKGRRPSFYKAEDPLKAKTLYNSFISELKKRKIICEQGEFGSNMEINLINDGPFTLILNSNKN